MKPYAENRKAHFDYVIVDTIEAGIELTGQEVKSIRNGKARVDTAYALIREGKAQALGIFITPYQEKNTTPTYIPDHTRILLLHKSEIEKIEKKCLSDKLTIIVLSLYSKGRKIKVLLGLARGKKLYDKRQTLKERAVDRDIKREYKVH